MIDVVFYIVEAMMHYIEHQGEFRGKYAMLKLEPGQSVRTEDLLRIFIDHLQEMIEFIQ